MFRLFLDEVGHHNINTSDDPNERYLGLTGVIMYLPQERGTFTDGLNEIKQRIFGRSDFSLHRRDIINKHPEPFDRLRDADRKTEFDALLLGLISNRPYRAITAVIDKKEHRQKYKVWHFQPYHYCLTVILERYVRWLETTNLRVSGDVMAESRGKKENKQLAKSYQRIYEHGTDFLPAKLFQRWLTSGEIKIKSKTDNIAGLQLTDLIANPACRDLICRHTGVAMTAEFGRKIVEVLYSKKYVRSVYGGKIEGYGTKWLP